MLYWQFFFSEILITRNFVSNVKSTAKIRITCLLLTLLIDKLVIDINPRSLSVCILLIPFLRVKGVSISGIHSSDIIRLYPSNHEMKIWFLERLNIPNFDIYKKFALIFSFTHYSSKYVLIFFLSSPSLIRNYIPSLFYLLQHEPCKA